MKFQYEQQAARGDAMPDWLTQPDQLLYQSMAILYARYRAGFITRDAAVEEKGRLLYEWENNRARLEFAACLAEWHAKLRREIEAAQNAYRRDPSMETAEKLSKVLDGILTV